MNSQERAKAFDAYVNALYELAKNGDEEAMMYVGGTPAETERRLELIRGILNGQATLVERLHAQVVMKRLEE